ncbi:MAG: hypothetical protein A9Z00_00055 [Thermobacillus sp. ZCTH02-B1]|uniref:hypothetical protein n=1 Tax=Thermobacillus sp. ZCTH02-B1 TaxID=1858795 RepID=UPI000B581E1E|nr:hypothetical protein [Thermobacillus sp. ZCTH02-B1]OUM94017.1 MAG: hypothetical protein A9Z00_00055 [Thermobacillus sp. ZCTH02-B1]
MFICFAEYRIAEENRERYLELMARLRPSYPMVYLYEGTDQPGLFVEVWEAGTREEAERLRAMRLAPDSPWNPVNRLASGTVRMWMFHSV